MIFFHDFYFRLDNNFNLVCEIVDFTIFLEML
jgi:hypothetical protein